MDIAIAIAVVVILVVVGIYVMRRTNALNGTPTTFPDDDTSPDEHEAPHAQTTADRRARVLDPNDEHQHPPGQAAPHQDHRQGRTRLRSGSRGRHRRTD